MRRLISLLCILCLCLPLQALRRHRRIVVLISLDGFPAYALRDAQLPIPTLRMLQSDGASASGMVIVNPTVTWPNHTTLVTGVDASRHGVIFNGELERHGHDQPVTINVFPKKTDLVTAQTVYDLASRAGLDTAQVDWPATKDAKTIRWSFAERPDPDGAIAQDLIQQGIASRAQLASFSGSQAWRDEIYADAAVDILQKHTPNLLLVHFLETDSIQHEYGPVSEAADLAYAFADDRVKQIVDAVRSAGLLERTTIFVVSDHGFRTVHHVVRLNAVLAQNSLVHPNGARTTASVWTLSHGGVSMVYVIDPKQRADLIPKLTKMFHSVQGVENVYSAQDFPRLGLPSISQNRQAPDLFVTAKPDYAFNDDVEGPVSQTIAIGGEHGYLKTDSAMNAIFIAWGAGIRSHVHLGTIQNVDVAPTIAKMLGISMKNIQGHPLNQVLK